ncbi:hypothetical protein PRIPAC_87107, partial [Pristionchus pacificus]|uniref:CRAL-TRIO domain-containing protein n=1 Tax=Pristionchus pacificus TaxID=54126 RepID=A0A8R1V2Y1_PRIPA
IDLDELKLHPSLISIVTGPYRILWATCYMNYPEWLNTVLIVNCPPFTSLLWRAISPLLPERTRNKVRICCSSSEAKVVVRSFVSASHLPVQWG